MKIETRRANRATEWRSLQKIDKRSYPHDFWEREDYLEKGLIVFWILYGGKKVAWVGFWHNMRFTEGDNWTKNGCLYLGSVSIDPGFTSPELIASIMEWLFAYVRANGFTAISTNEHESNPLVQSYLGCGFKVISVTDGYWEDPAEPNVVLEYAIE